jgi:TonB family protein
MGEFQVMTHRATGTAGALAGLAWIGLAWAGLGGAAVAQEGTGDPVFAIRGDEVQSVFPAAAKAKGLDGEATVTCQAAQKRIWACALTAETAAGQGFGEAALALVRRYEVAPPRDRATAAPRAFVIPFVAPKARIAHLAGVEYTAPLPLEGPSRDALYAAWPRAARFSGVEGVVDLRCTVTLDGRARDCVVLAQRGGAQGLDAAALSMAPLYRFQPGRKRGAPVPMSTLVRVPFVCDYRCRPFEGEATRSLPVWRGAPAPAEVLAAYPPAARARGVEGQVRLDCMASAEGRLQDCRVVAESVKGEDFGAAALGLTTAFRLPRVEAPPPPPIPRDGIGAAMLGVGKTPRRPPPVVDAAPTPQTVTIAFGTQIGQPQWMRAQTRSRVMGPDGKTPVRGKARARCRVGGSGDLEACQILKVEPAADPNVEREALMGLDAVQAQLWTEEGRSTIGATVVLDVPVGEFARPSIVASEVELPKVAPGVVDYQPLIRLANQVDFGGRYYPDRAQRMEVPGKVELSCPRIVDGQPDGCTVVSEAPLEYGFGEAALKMSRFFRFSPETIDGAPTDEAIQIPVVFSVPR